MKKASFLHSFFFWATKKESPKKPQWISRWWFLQYVWNFQPYPVVEMIQFDEHIFQRGWRKTTKLDFSMSKVEGKVEGAIAEGVSHFLKHCENIPA